MKLIVGLGNPGTEFDQTRHNAGFIVVDELAKVLNQSLGGSAKWQDRNKFFSQVVQIGDVLLAKPQTYMNDSGKAVQALLQFYKIANQDLWVVHDDLDIELGKYKIQHGTGPKVHNGLASMYQSLGSQAFWHVRIGVDGREGDRTLPGHVYVLQRLSGDELALFNQTSQELVKNLVTKLT